MGWTDRDCRILRWASFELTGGDSGKEGCDDDGSDSNSAFGPGPSPGRVGGHAGGEMPWWCGVSIAADAIEQVSTARQGVDHTDKGRDDGTVFVALCEAAIDDDEMETGGLCGCGFRGRSGTDCYMGNAVVEGTSSATTTAASNIATVFSIRAPQGKAQERVRLTG